MFIGEYHHNLDEKNRLIIPSKFRDNLSGSCVITKGLDKCLFIYPISTWQKITESLNNLPFTSKDARNFMRFFSSGATEANFDKQGRIQLTINLLEYANILKECTIIGVYDRIEIWNTKNWNEFIKNNENSLSEIAENLFDGGK